MPKKQKQQLTTTERLELHNRAALIKSAREKLAAGRRLSKQEIEAVEQTERGKAQDKPKPDEHYRTQTEIANAHSVNQRTVARWVTVPDFPKKGSGGWSKSAVDSFVAKNTLGKGPTEHKVNGVTLTEANIRKTIEDAENARIKKEMAIAEQARQLGRLVDIEDVRRIFQPAVATAKTMVDALVDAVDRAMPESVPAEVRERVLGLCRKLGADLFAVMKELA